MTPALAPLGERCRPGPIYIYGAWTLGRTLHPMEWDGDRESRNRVPCDERANDLYIDRVTTETRRAKRYAI